MHPVAKPVFKQEPAHHHLRLGILAPDAAHVVASYFGFVDVGHSGELYDPKLAK